MSCINKTEGISGRARNKLSNYCKIKIVMHCNQYAVLRQPLLDRADTVNPNLDSLIDTDKLCFVLIDHNMCRISANICFNILNSRMVLSV